MEVEVLQENLNSALSTVGRVVSSHPQLPILSHILLEAKDGKLTLLASNSETTVRTTLGAKVTTEGQFTVPARTFQELISSLSPEKVVLQLTEGQLQVNSKNFKGKVNGTSASEYPALGLTASSTFSWTVPCATLQQAISRVCFAAATDESRVILTGVLLEVVGDSLQLVAVDGFRLSLVKLPLPPKGEQLERMVIPSRTLQEVAKLTSKEDITIDLLDDGQLRFTQGDCAIYSRLIAGNFPEFGKIIPTGFDSQIILEADSFARQLKSAGIFARDSANIVRLTLQVEEGKLQISANAAQVGENQTEIDVEFTKKPTEDLAIAFNYRYLLDLLNVSTKGQEVIGEFTNSTAAGVFRFKGEENFFHLIMPVRVQN